MSDPVEVPSEIFGALISLLRRELREAIREALVDAQEGRAVEAQGDELLTSSEVAERLGKHPVTIRKWAREGRIPAIQVGDEWRFDVDAVRASFPSGGSRVISRRRTSGSTKTSAPDAAGNGSGAGHQEG